MLGLFVFAFILSGIFGGLVYLYQMCCQLDLEIAKLDKVTAEEEKELVKLNLKIAEKKAEYAALNFKSIELELKIADRLGQLDLLSTSDGKSNRVEDKFLSIHYFGDYKMLMCKDNLARQVRG